MIDRGSQLAANEDADVSQAILRLLQVNDRLETTATNVWAMRECAGSPYFTHVSEQDFSIIHENLNGGHRSTADRLIPYCVFIDPELAHVGLAKRKAREKNIAYRIASVPIDAGHAGLDSFRETWVHEDADRRT